ncbi:hypothetical protein NQ317_010477 [Molorchus minor]|uniref:Uncharacterized protein n=1 Tax=Molorchus minor TaxID=1323400 RepID=A0ABQ9JZQ5_9CUCU|nr:hypothetical protein NQ317_010477 [Molorchus minor]
MLVAALARAGLNAQFRLSSAQNEEKMQPSDIASVPSVFVANITASFSNVVNPLYVKAAIPNKTPEENLRNEQEQKTLNELNCYPNCDVNVWLRSC